MADTNRATAPGVDYGRDPRELIRKIAIAVRGILNGKTNNTREVTLRAGQTTTTLTDASITAATALVFSALTAHAATAMTAVWWEPTVGAGTIHHNNTADTDRTFRVVLHG